MQRFTKKTAGSRTCDNVRFGNSKSSERKNRHPATWANIVTKRALLPQTKKTVRRHGKLLIITWTGKVLGPGDLTQAHPSNHTLHIPKAHATPAGCPLSASHSLAWPPEVWMATIRRTDSTASITAHRAQRRYIRRSSWLLPNKRRLPRIHMKPIVRDGKLNSIFSRLALGEERRQGETDERAYVTTGITQDAQDAQDAQDVIGLCERRRRRRWSSQGICRDSTKSERKQYLI